MKKQTIKFGNEILPDIQSDLREKKMGKKKWRGMRFYSWWKTQTRPQRVHVVLEAALSPRFLKGKGEMVILLGFFGALKMYEYWKRIEKGAIKESDVGGS